MFVEILIAMATLLVAFNGLTYQPKKDPDQRVSWGNLNLHGRLLIFLLSALTVLGLIKMYTFNKEVRREAEEQEAQIVRRNEENQRLLVSQEELKKINQHLMKVMSVADGYNASVRGVVSFSRPVRESEIRSALRNLFLKYAEIQISAENFLGSYEGKIHYATHPEVRRFRHLAEVETDSELGVFLSHGGVNSYYFDIRCSKIKILNSDKIQYVKYDSDDDVDVRIRGLGFGYSFQEIYHVTRIYVHEVVIEELGEFLIRKKLLI